MFSGPALRKSGSVTTVFPSSSESRRVLCEFRMLRMPTCVRLSTLGMRRCAGTRAIRHLKSILERLVVKVRVELHDVDRAGEPPHDRICDRVIAPQNRRKNALVCHSPRYRSNVIKRVDDVGGKNGRIANVDNAVDRISASRNVAPVSGS